MHGALQILGDESPFVGGATSTPTAERVLSMYAVGGHHIVIRRFPEGALDIGSTAGPVLAILGLWQIRRRLGWHVPITDEEDGRGSS